MTRRAPSLALWVGAFVAAAEGCSGRSVVIGADPGGSGGDLLIGGASTFGGTPATGGSFVVGGTGGTAYGGTSGSVGGGIGEAGEGSIFDPYPRVAYEGGQGYRRSCPNYGDTWGFTCWHFDGEPHACSPSGEPYCNACSCASPRCDVGEFQCPLGIMGHGSSCIGSVTTAPSCFLTCGRDADCPTGMTCSRYPGTEAMVCVWLSENPFGQPPL